VGENGGLYLLDMGEPVRIRDLAEQMIRFYGFEPETDIQIEYTGLRPGERLDERLWSADEEPRETEHSRILRVDRKRPLSIDISGVVDALRPICRFDPRHPEMYRNAAMLRAILTEAIPGMETETRHEAEPVYA
jgi:FlaA1/EpsC-like NDP-sugar epimerase